MTRRLTTLFLALLAIAAVIARGVRETREVEARPVEVSLARLPEAFDGYRILLLSCLHLEGNGETERALAGLLKGREFDLALIAGDFRRSQGTLEQTRLGLDTVLPAIRAKDGILACRGNHDTPSIIRLVRERGVGLLVGEAIAIHRDQAAIWVAGVSEPRGDAADVSRALRDVPTGAFKVLIGHNPDVAAPASAAGVDLVLAGDTHGGQIVLPLVGAVVTKTTIGRRFVYGMNRLGNTWVYTNPGIGTTGLKLRLGRPPEATILTLRRARS